MPTPQNEINSEIFGRINALEKVTKEMKEFIDRELDAAIEAGDPKAVERLSY